MTEHGMDPAEAQNVAVACLKKYFAENWDVLSNAGFDPEEITASLPG